MRVGWGYGVEKEWVCTCTYVCTCVMYGMRVWCMCVCWYGCMIVVKARRTHVAGPPSWVKDVGVLYRRRVVVEDPLLLAARVPPAGGGGAHHGEVVVVLHGLVAGDDCFRKVRSEAQNAQETLVILSLKSQSWSVKFR